MLKYILALVVLIGSLSATSQAQTPLLQALIDATPAGGTLTLPADVVYPCACVIRKSITIESHGARPVRNASGEFFVGATVVSALAEPAFYIEPGVDGVRLFGLEVRPQGFVYDVIRIGTTGVEQDTEAEAPRNITLDRMWIHGLPDEDSQRGVAANGVNVTITNSRIDEIHGRGYDTQAICAWNGPGPFVITDNYLEGAGENVMFGGALATIPGLIADGIQFRRNHVVKPLSWKKGDPAFVPLPPNSALDHWSVKNLFELKNARNVVIDSCVFENSWGDAQIGYAILFTVRGEGNNQMPHATVQNVEFTNNIVRNAEQGFQTLGIDYANASTQGSGLRIYNNLFEGIGNWFFVLQSFNNVTIEHNTHNQGGNILVLTGNPSLGFVYRNNATLRDPDSFGVHGGGIGEGTAALESYTPGYVFAGNVIAAALEGLYPTGNFYPADLSNLLSFKGTDGLTPGYMGGTTSPLPTPTPLPSPAPSPSPSPTPSSSPRCVRFNPKGKCTRWF